MWVVTGGAGFIGSNIVQGLNRRGERDILVVDDLKDGTKFTNLADLHIADYMDKKTFRKATQKNRLPDTIRGVLHQGACSTTTEWDGRFMMKNNFEYSKMLLDFCAVRGIPFIYASSASVYGSGKEFVEEPRCEKPLNVYGYSKLLFDQYVRRRLDGLDNQVVGLRYFNVYGPREQHKGSMASVAWHFHNQVDKDGEARLFAGCDGYGDGEQKRDFVYVGDVVAVNLWFLDNPDKSGIFNLGTGAAQRFNDVARAVISWHGKGVIKYVPFPEHLKNRYQSYTQADMSRLREIGYREPFKTVEQGVTAYLDELKL